MCCRMIAMVCLGLLLVSGLARPAEAARFFSLGAPAELTDTGFLKYLLPRFSLKTGVRIEVVPAGTPADAVLLSDGAGTPVFEGLGSTWTLSVTSDGDEAVARFVDWITGDVGRRTIDTFPEKDGIQFAVAEARSADVAVVALPGDAVEGEALAVRHCGRCHMVNEATRMSSIGSTPSFAVMRTFKDWQERFEAFFVLRPHPAFTIIEDVTEPFDETRPPPIVPVEMTLEDLEALMAYVSRVPPADLGAQIQYQ